MYRSNPLPPLNPKTSTQLRSLLQTSPPYQRHPHKHASFRNLFLSFRLLLDPNRSSKDYSLRYGSKAQRLTPPSLQDHLVLVEEIERVTGDTWSRGHFINLVRHVDEQTVYAALSVTREKMALESGVNAGAYFTATLKGMMGLAGLGREIFT